MDLYRSQNILESLVQAADSATHTVLSAHLHAAAKALVVAFADLTNQIMHLKNLPLVWFVLPDLHFVLPDLKQGRPGSEQIVVFVRICRKKAECTVPDCMAIHWMVIHLANRAILCSRRPTHIDLHFAS